LRCSYSSAADDPHKIGGIQLDGYLKGASVLVFNHQKQPGVRIDEESVRSLHEALATKVGSRMFVIAPALTFDFQQDYIEFDRVRYYALRIPYSIIHELHQREFSALKQPSDELAVNDTVEAVGFDFIRTPELEYVCGSGKRKGELLTEAHIRIKTFKSEAVVREPLRKKGNRETLSMVMLDCDYDGDIFGLDHVFYADEIEKAGWEVRFLAEVLGKQIMAVFVDIYGNEARELIPATRFGAPTKRSANAAKGKKMRRKKLKV
jgi:site-specific DNA-methyltransferase (adenine-specific)/adenine-specific DNA-methyltransferase